MTSGQAGAQSDERAALLAEVAARAPASLRPASLASADPLRPLPGALLAKSEVRARAGYDRTGPDHPRRERGQQIVVLALVGALVAALAVIALVTGHDALALVAALLTALDVVLAGALRTWVRADPLRIRPPERHALTAAAWWQSSQPWTDALARGPERALLGVAVDTVAQIASSPAWRSGYLDGHRLVFDLAAELDAVDAHAFEVARARMGGGTGNELNEAWDSCLDRVLALRQYAHGLVELSRQVAHSDALMHAAPAIGQLRGATDQGQFAVEGVQRLTGELAVISASIASTAAEVNRQRE